MSRPPTTPSARGGRDRGASLLLVGLDLPGDDLLFREHYHFQPGPPLLPAGLVDAADLRRSGEADLGHLHQGHGVVRLRVAAVALDGGRVVVVPDAGEHHAPFATKLRCTYRTVSVSVSSGSRGLNPSRCSLLVESMKNQHSPISTSLAGRSGSLPRSRAQRSSQCAAATFNGEGIRSNGGGRWAIRPSRPKNSLNSQLAAP